MTLGDAVKILGEDKEIRLILTEEQLSEEVDIFNSLDGSQKEILKQIIAAELMNLLEDQTKLYFHNLGKKYSLILESK